MKQISKIGFIFILISAFLFVGGCRLEEKPHLICPKCAGNLTADEIPYSLDVDFSGKEKLIIISGKENPYSSYYCFQGNTVRLCYDELETELDANALPDTNPALLTYRLFSALEGEAVKWEKQKDGFHFSLKIQDCYCAGDCDVNGKVLSFEVPEYKLYFKANF